jgi:hypothetical protein
MTNLSLPLLLAFLLMSPLQLVGQITVTELTTDRKIVALDSAGSFQYPIVDINSSLLITFDIEKIKDEALNRTGIPVKIPTEKIAAMLELLKMQQEMITWFNAITPEMPREERIKALNEFSIKTLELLSFVTDNYEETDPFYQKVNTIFGQGTEEDYSDFYIALEAELNRLNDEISAKLEEKKVFFQFGGYLRQLDNVTRPIHIPQFDTYEAGEFFEVPRFVTAISQEEQQLFDQYQKTAEAYRNDVKGLLKNLSEEIIGQIDTLLNELNQELQAEINQLIAAQQEIQQANAALAEQIKTSVDTISMGVSGLRSQLSELKLAATNFESANYLSALLTAVNGTIEQAKQIKNLLESEALLLQSSLQTLGTEFTEIAQNVTVTLDSATQKTTAFIEVLEGTFKNKVNKISQSRIFEQKVALEEFGEEVHQIKLDNIPASTQLDLRTTGFRREGDDVVLRARIGTETEAPGGQACGNCTLYEQTFVMHQVLFHAIIRASLIYATKTSGGFENADNDFQLAPSFSLLVKKGSRKRAFVTKYIDPGLGINIATLDFDNNNVPEVGIGLVGSAVNDFLQIGIGRNMALDDYYWFFGLRIPFLGLSLPKTQNTEIE